MKAEVVPNRHGLPRLQLVIYEWLRRTPANVERLVVSSSGSPVLNLSADEVLELGMEETAARIHGQCEAIATHNEHQTAFQATWYSGNDVAIVLPFHAGSGVRSTQQYDGSAVSLISQMQTHQHRLLLWSTDTMGTMLKAQNHVIERQNQHIERLMQRDLEVQQRQDELRAEEIAALEASTTGGDDGRMERILSLMMMVAERAGVLPAAPPPPPLERRH